MGTSITAIRNLGPAMELGLGRAGVEDAETLNRLGTDEAYRRFMASSARPHFMAFCAIEMGPQNRDMNDCRGLEKAALRARYEALKAAMLAAAPNGIHAALDEFGIRRPDG